MTPWSAETVETVLAAQRIGLAPGRAQRLATAVQALLEASMADPLRDEVELEREAAGFLAAMERLGTR